MKFTRMQVYILVLILLTWMPLDAALGQAWRPNKPIRLMVGFAAGGSTDIAARTLAAKLSDSLGQAVVVENVGGMSGLVAADRAAKAPPDGYSLLIAGPELLSATNKDLGLVAVASVATSPLVAVGRPGSTATTLANKSNVSIYAQGFYAPMLAEKQTRGTVKRVDAKGTVPAITDIVSGQLDVAILPYAFVKEAVTSGKVVVLSALGGTQIGTLSASPSMLGVTGELPPPYLGIFTPRGTPQSVLDELHSAINRALQNPDLRERFNSIGVAPRVSSQSSFSSDIKVLYGVISDKCKKKDTCDADNQCPQPCPTSN